MVWMLCLLLTPLLGGLLCSLAARVDGPCVRFAAAAAMLIDIGFAVGLASVVYVSGPVSASLPWIPSVGVRFSLAADGLACVLILLTALLGLLAVLVSWREIQERAGSFHFWLLMLQTGILAVFLARDALLFYLGWELMLVPMFFLIGVWGHEDRLYSARKFFFFTFTGSIFMLVALLHVHFRHLQLTGASSFELQDLVATGARLGSREQVWVFAGLLVGFAVKVPLLPLHTWLPDAHTQAPTAGSLILAGLLLKTGTYGLMRFAIPIAPAGAATLAPVVIALSLCGIYYGAAAAFAQKDFKRLVAYSSVSHLGFIVLGIAVGGDAGTRGAVLQMINHGLATGALFLVGGMLQERFHTRSLDDFGGLWACMPVLGGFLLFFSLASLGLPGTGSFVGELYIIAAAFEYRWWLGAAACGGILLAAAYSLRLFCATMHGGESGRLHGGSDASKREVFVLGILALLLLVIGFVPRAVTGMLSAPEPVRAAIRAGDDAAAHAPRVSFNVRHAEGEADR